MCFRCFLLQKLWHHLFPSKDVDHYTEKTSWIAIVIGIFFSLMSVSRTIALYQGNSFLSLVSIKTDYPSVIKVIFFSLMSVLRTITLFQGTIII